MAARRYEISLLVLKNIFNIYFQHEKRNFVSPSGHVISSTCEDTKFSRESLPGISWVFI